MENKDTDNFWLSKYIKPIPPSLRLKLIGEISEASSPKFDFFLLVILSSAIATLGLITDSPAVIIGAMLVAPLMSPIIGLGLASMIGNSTLARNSFSALFRGALLSITISLIITVTNINLPFLPSFLLDIPKEIVSRTQPSPNDLIIALAGGIAAAYAMTHPRLSATLPGVAIATALMPPLSTIGIGIAIGRWDIAGGATLLFLTNAVTIAFAATVVFFLHGFSPVRVNTDSKIPKSLIAAAFLTGLLLISLSFFSFRLFSQVKENQEINQIIEKEVEAINDTDVIEMIKSRTESGINLEISIRTNRLLTHSQVVGIQQALVQKLEQPISLVINQVFADRLDPLNPPTPTFTNTLGPSPTATYTATFTATATHTATSTKTITVTPLPTNTPQPASAKVIPTQIVPFYYLYQEPGGPVISQLKTNQILIVLYNKENFQGLVWVEVMDEDGRLGWIPEIYLSEVTPTPTATINN